ncbi:MAG: hypothetical protein ABUL44_01305, partial [Flavobacterium sp.]
FEPGDEVYHLSDSSIIWIVEKVVNDDIFCSTLIRETREQKKEKFAKVTLAKKNKGKGFDGIVLSSKTRRNHY